MMTLGRMTATARKPALAAIFAAALAACHFEPKVEENAVPRPEEYREQIESFVRNQLTDPTGIRNAFISTPALRPVAANTMRYVVCIKYDAKDNNEPRRYAAKEIAAIFYDRRVQQFTGATPALCSQVAYQPYPELQKLCREVVCPR